MRHTLHILLIFAFILSGISPACAFISGKSSIDLEICTADGMKVIKVAGDEAPSDQKDHEHKKASDCQFCFAQTHLKFSKASAPVHSIAQSAFTDRLAFDHSVQTKKFELSALAARGPPLI